MSLKGSVYIIFHSFSSNLYFLFQEIFPVGVSLFSLSNLYMACVPFFFFFLDISVVKEVELGLSFYFLCSLNLIFSSSQGQALPYLNIVRNLYQSVRGGIKKFVH